MLDFICRNLIQSVFTSQSVECISNTQESSNPNNDREGAEHSYRAPEELQEDRICSKGCDLAHIVFKQPNFALSVCSMSAVAGAAQP